MKSISEFIQEQETGYTVNVNKSDEQLYVECMSAISLASCYAEQAILMEFASENGISTLSMIQEDGTEKAEKKDGIFKRAGGAIKKAGHAIAEFVKEIIRKIKSVFTSAKYKKMSEDIPKEDYEKEVKIDASVYAPLAILEVLGNTETYFTEASMNKGQLAMVSTALEEIGKAFAGKKNPVEGFKEIKKDSKTYNTFFNGEFVGKINESDKDGKITTTYGDYAKTLIDLARKDPAKKLAEKAEKAINEFEKTYNPEMTSKSYKRDDEFPVDASNEDIEAKGYEKGYDPKAKEDTWVKTTITQDPVKTEIIKRFKDFVNIMNKCYDAGIKAVDNKVYPAKKEEGTAKQESFYFV